MDSRDYDNVFKGFLIAFVFFLLLLWSSGVGEPKYDSKAEYDAAVEAGIEAPPTGYQD